MNKIIPIFIFSLLIIIILSSPSHVYAWLQTYEIYSYEPYGFLSGIWHGLIAPFAVFAQLFDDNIVLYSAVNTGFGYNFGFLIGISAIIGGGSKGVHN